MLSRSFFPVVQSANCILLLTSKCEAHAYIICKSTSILSLRLFFLFPLTYSHTILTRCPSANQLATTTSKKTKYESSQMSPEAYPGAL
jgi:hypothetical protein